MVVGLPNYYYWDGFYLRLDAGRWVQASYLDAQWAPCPADRVPGGAPRPPANRTAMATAMDTELRSKATTSDQTRSRRASRRRPKIRFSCSRRSWRSILSST